MIRHQTEVLPGIGEATLQQLGEDVQRREILQMKLARLSERASGHTDTVSANLESFLKSYSWDEESVSDDPNLLTVTDHTLTGEMFREALRIGLGGLLLHAARGRGLGQTFNEIENGSTLPELHRVSGFNLTTITPGVELLQNRWITGHSTQSELIDDHGLVPITLDAGENFTGEFYSLISEPSYGGNLVGLIDGDTERSLFSKLVDPKSGKPQVELELLGAKRRLI